MPPDGHRLGPFVLGALVGAGGMGRVYQGTHADLGVPVAIKALVGMQSAEALPMLRAEVEAMAGLDHPHIARVFDHGVADGGVLGRGTPWFAMELLRSDLRRELSMARHWSMVAPYVLQLLDALGHAHAHGVIHRDLKSGNVLVGRSDDLRPGLKLVDFGIAAVHQQSAQLVGTPTAMAPEQWTEGLSDIGPWTDLYALATLVWRLVTGVRPTGQAAGPGIWLRQRDEQFEDFAPRFAVPDGLEPWLRTALSFDPSDRYACCADATAALHGLGVLDDITSGPVRPLPALADELTESSKMTVPVDRVDADDGPRARRVALPPSPVPRTWQAPLPPPASVHLAGVGRSLLPWRQVPFVGREGEREALWQATRDALDHSRAMRVHLEGAAGVGLSALGRWWVRRLRTTSGTIGVVADDTLSTLVDQLLQPLGVAGDHEGRERGLARWRADFRVGTDALAVLDGQATRELRVGAVLEILRCLARRRPLALFVDGQAPGLTSLLARVTELGPRVMVLSSGARTSDGPCTTLPVRPMPKPELSMLLDQLLPLAPALHRKVLDASGGRPATLRGLVLRLLPDLRPGPQGFDGTLPATDDHHPLDALSDFSDDDRQLLEVAVVSSASVHRAIWVRAAQVAPRRVDALADGLVRRGLATSTPSGWAVAPELATALRHRAQDAGRSPAHHAAVAHELELRGGDPLEVCRCWLGAGQVARGAEGLLDQASRLLREHGAIVTMDALEEVLGRLEALPEREALHGRMRLRLAMLRQESGHGTDEASARALLRWALDRGWYDTAASATRLLAWVVTLDQERLNAAYAEADATFLSRASPAARARMLAAWYLRLERFADPRRDDVLARVRADGALALTQLSHPEDVHEMKLLLAAAERARAARDGPPEELLARARRCVELSRRTGAAHLCLDLVELGHAHRRAGQPDQADGRFQEAAWTARWLRLPRAEAFATGNRAGLAALRGDWLRCAQLAQRALVGADHAYLRAVLELFCVVPTAHAGRAEEVEAVLQRLGPELRKVRPIDDEVDAALAGIVDALAGDHPAVAAVATALR